MEASGIVVGAKGEEENANPPGGSRLTCSTFVGVVLDRQRSAGKIFNPSRMNRKRYISGSITGEGSNKESPINGDVSEISLLTTSLGSSLSQMSSLGDSALIFIERLEPVPLFADFLLQPSDFFFGTLPLALVFLDLLWESSNQVKMPA